MTADERTQDPGDAPLPRSSPRRRLQVYAAWAYTLLSWGVLGAVVLQVYLAGAGLFSDASYLGHHRSWVHYFQDWPLLMLLASFLAPFSWTVRGLTLLLRGLIGAQFGLLQAAPHLVAGLHTVNALAIIWLAAFLAREGRRQVRSATEWRGMEGTTGS